MKREDREKVSSSLKLLAKTSFIVFIGVLISKIATYAYRSMVVNYYGLEVYGLLSLALMVVGWFMAVASLGVADGALRFMSLFRGKNQIDRAKYVFRSSTLFLTITSVIAGLVLFFTSTMIANGIFHNSQLTIYLQIFSFLIPVTGIASPIVNVVRTYEKISWFSFINNILPNVTKVAVLVILFFLGVNYLSVPYSTLFGSIAIIIVTFFYVRKSIPEMFKKPILQNKIKKTVLLEVFNYSWPMLFFGLISSIYGWIDSFAIGYFKDATAVGLYNTALPIALLMTLAPELFMQLFFPMIAKEYGGGKKSVIREVSKQVSKWIFALNLPILILLLIFPGTFLNILFGASSLGAENTLRLLAVGLFFSSLATVTSSLMSTSGRSRVVLTNLVITAVINIFLNIFLVPKYGIDGAAFATMLSYMILAVILAFESRKYLGITPLRRKMLNVFIAGVIPGAILFYIKRYFDLNIYYMILLVVVFAAVYLTIAVLIGGFDKHDREIVKNILKKVPFGFIQNRIN